jgi:hypothetical protein
MTENDLQKIFPASLRDSTHTDSPVTARDVAALVVHGSTGRITTYETTGFPLSKEWRTCGRNGWLRQVAADAVLGAKAGPWCVVDACERAIRSRHRTEYDAVGAMSKPQHFLIAVD